MMCAAVAGQRGRSVLLIDHSTKLGEKIRISGGGRCNFTNLHTRPEAFLSRNPHFCRAALARYTPADFIALVERHGIQYHEKTLGQLFCDESAVQIIDMLRAECDAGGVQWAMPATVKQITRAVDTTVYGARFELTTSRGIAYAQSVVIASGGLSVPKIGASAFGYRIAEQFGLAVVPPKPALVPLAASPEWLAQFGSLSGTSFETIATTTSAKRNRHPEFRESALVTHRGLSGPAILQISSYWQMAGSADAIALDLLPDLSSQQIRTELSAHRTGHEVLGTRLALHLPKRFAHSYAQAHGWTQPLAQTPNAILDAMTQSLKAWQIRPAGTLGYAKAEVTLGGVDTAELSQQTMQAHRVAGLYFIGEVVDVTGWLGGYNFQWAWASAHAAGKAV